MKEWSDSAMADSPTRSEAKGCAQNNERTSTQAFEVSFFRRIRTPRIPVYCDASVGVCDPTLKNQKQDKSNYELETVEEVENVADVVDIESIESIDDEDVSRQQIDSVLQLASQLNIDIKAAFENTDADMAEELDYLIADEKAQLDILLPRLKKSPEWTSADETKLRSITAEYKKLSRKYKSKK